MTRRRGILYITGALLLLVPPVVWIVYSIPATAHEEKLPVERHLDQGAAASSPLEEVAARDPMELVALGMKRYQENIKAYRCTLVKQERLDGKLSDVQEVEVRYRETPRSIYMLWHKNAGQAKRALYMETDDFVNEEGERLVRVEPAGAVARLFVSDLFVPVHGEQARKSSRRTIDECGFDSTFRLLERYNTKAKERGVLDLKYVGTGEVDGRPTFVIVRQLPEKDPENVYPDARMVMHLDQEWLLPVAVYSYADHEETELLGRYVFTRVELDPAFEQDAFKF